MATPPPTPETGELALAVRGVTKRYDGFTAVDRLSFSLRRGEIYGFLGQNGAGKTTTLRMVMDIIQPTAGTVTVAGDNDQTRYRKNIGYLPEERGLYRKMRAADTIAYFARLKGLSAKEARCRATDLLDQYGLGPYARARIETLSKGMAQKVQILATIAHRPEILIFDEPFSGLDPVNQRVLEDLILAERDRGATILFSTHIMSHAERLCDRFLILRQGRKIFEGTLEEARATEAPALILRTPDDPLPLIGHPAIADIVAADSGRYRLELEEGADSQALLAAILQAGIRVTAFGEEETSLHDLFFRMAGGTVRPKGSVQP